MAWGGVFFSKLTLFKKEKGNSKATGRAGVFRDLALTQEKLFGTVEQQKG
jgi:hypothetical protein